MIPRHSTTSFSIKNRSEKLILVRESILYGLSLEILKTDKASVNRGIISTPNIVFYSNNTKCLIDYTNQTNSDIEPKITEYFSQVPRGATLTCYNGVYSDVNSNKSADLSGTYKFQTYFNGIIEADVVSVAALPTVINRYDKNFFENIPYFVADSFSSKSVKNILKNKFGKNTKNSFNYLGVKVGDYVKITDIESPIKILEIQTDSDGNEFLTLDASITPKDLTNKKTKVQVYIMVSDEVTELANLNEKDVGACIEYINNVIVACTDNHTVSQCRFRSNKENQVDTEITLNTFCRTPETDTAVQKTVTESLVQITSALVNSMSSTSTSNTVGPILKNSGSRNSFYGRTF